MASGQNSISMLRLTLAISTLFFAVFAFANGPVQVTANLNGCESVDSIYLFTFNGFGFRTVAASAVSDNTVKFEVPSSSVPKFYYFGVEANNMRPILLGTEPIVKLAANCKALRTAQVHGSPVNARYDEVKEELNRSKGVYGQLVQQYRTASSNPDLKEELERRMAELDAEKLRYLDSVSNAAPFLGKIVALNTYLSFQNHGAKYSDELNYFGNEYFSQVNWEDAGYNDLPWVFEAWKTYTETLSNVGLQAGPHKAFVDANLKKIPENTSAHRLALSGIITALQQKEHPNFSEYAQRYLAMYGKTDPQASAALQEQIDRVNAFAVGGEAPDFTQNMPDGKSLTLSELRGRYVLIDFWASWCGPCRRENPHVVKLYDQYKDKGFTVLGVSLDRDQERWLKAIEADNLTWYQVSDLKGWSNSVAQLYGVRSIPHTVLLDPEGKIVARNLRGASLDNTLQELLGD